MPPGRNGICNHECCTSGRNDSRHCITRQCDEFTCQAPADRSPIYQQPLNISVSSRPVITDHDGLVTLTRHAYASGFSLAVFCAGLVSLLMAAGLVLLCSRLFRAANPADVSAG